MDVTFEEYIDFINHLFLQELVDFDYKFRNTGSTSESLAIIGD